MFLWCVRDGWRDIYSGDFFLSHTFSGSQGVPTLAPPCKLVRDYSDRCVFLARLRFSAPCLNLTAWFSSRDLLPVTHLFDLSALIVLSCLLITTRQLVKAHGLTRNEPKIHGICYITNFFTQFPVDLLAHPVVPSLIFFLCKFYAFASYEIDRFFFALLFFKTLLRVFSTSDSG